MPSGIGLRIHDSFDVRITGAIEFTNFTTAVTIENDTVLNGTADARYARHVQIDSLSCYSNETGLSIDGVTGGVTIGTVHLSNTSNNFVIDSPYCVINGGQVTSVTSTVNAGANYCSFSNIQFNRNFGTHLEVNGITEGCIFSGCVFEKGSFGGAISLISCTGVQFDGGILDGNINHSTSAGTQYVQLSNMYLASGYSATGTTAQLLIRDCFDTSGTIP